MKAWGAKLKDSPKLARVLIFAVVLLFWLLALVPAFPNVAQLWVSGTSFEDRREIFVALLSASAIASGFSGVVSVFGLTADSQQFRAFRLKAGASLASNWTAVVSAGFISMAFCLTALILGSLKLDVLSVYSIMVAVLFLAENCIRNVWLLKKLVSVGDVSDRAAFGKE